MYKIVKIKKNVIIIKKEKKLLNTMYKNYIACIKC